MNNTKDKVITRAVRIYGVCDLRLEEFELPPLREDEILAKVMSDSACMSSYKAALQGEQHKRSPDDIAVNRVAGKDTAEASPPNRIQGRIT